MTHTLPAEPASSPAPARGLVVSNLSKAYPTPAEPLVVLHGVNFTLADDDRLAIVGPSGSGKSTLLNILGALDTPTSGDVLLDGASLFSLSQKALARLRAQRIGFIFQDHHLLPQCTALENTLIPRLALGKVGKSELERANDLLRRVGLADRATHLPAELSGGERQRVAIARALMNSPRLLLCDEPTGNLDTKTAAAVGQLLIELSTATHAILIVVTHSPGLAEMFPRRLGMVDGQLLPEPMIGQRL